MIGVGEALRVLEREHGIKREDLFIQTKFTSLNGQDPKNIPYDKDADLSTQVSGSQVSPPESYILYCSISHYYMYLLVIWRVVYLWIATSVRQVQQSLAKSLENLGVSYIDSLVMHSPMRTFPSTMQVFWFHSPTFHSHPMNGILNQIRSELSVIYKLSGLPLPSCSGKRSGLAWIWEIRPWRKGQTVGTVKLLWPQRFTRFGFGRQNRYIHNDV